MIVIGLALGACGPGFEWAVRNPCDRAVEITVRYYDEYHTPDEGGVYWYTIGPDEFRRFGDTVGLSFVVGAPRLGWTESWDSPGPGEFRTFEIPAVLCSP